MLRLHIYDLLKPELKAFEDLFELHYPKKGHSFQDMEIKTIYHRMEQELKELKKMIKWLPGAHPINRLDFIRREAFDVAMFGWFLAHRARLEMEALERRDQNGGEKNKTKSSTSTDDN